MVARDFRLKDPERQHRLQVQLPQRLVRLRERGERLGPECHDINTLHRIAADAEQLADVCRNIAADAWAQHLDALHAAITPLLHPARLPDRAGAARIATLIAGLATLKPPSIAGDTDVPLAIPGPTDELGFPLLTTTPESYWLPLDDPQTSATGAEEFAQADTMLRGHAYDGDGDGDHASSSANAASTPREHLLQRAAKYLAAATDEAPGALLVFAVPDAPARRNRMGANAFNTLCAEIGMFLAAHVGARDLVVDEADERFLLLNPDCDAPQLAAYALNLRDRIAREAFAATDERDRITLDVGVCPFAARARNVDAMREAAMQSIDAAHAIGQHGVFVLDNVLGAADLELVERIRNALDNNGFDLAFQPIMSMRGEDRAQFQALLRLHDDARQSRLAAELIPAATRAGLIGAIDRWVLDTCLALIATRGEGSAPRLFINQSLDSIRDAGHAQWLGERLQAHRVYATTLSLEVHARDAAAATADATRYATSMHELGASITLSGVEAGATGERLLLAMPIDFIKLSPRYLRFDDTALRDELQALVEFAHGNGQRVIAPRVEDARVAAALCNAGVDFIQGNFVQQAGAEFAFEFQSAVM